MQVATNMFGAETANLIVDAKMKGLKLIGIICPIINLDALYEIIRTSEFVQQRIITEISTIKKWQKQIKLGKIPAKEYEGEYSLDWIKSLDKKQNPYNDQKKVTSEWDENVYFLKGKSEGTAFEIEIHTQEQYAIHTKLYVYDKGIVITSGNITYHGTFLRQIELGVLITQEDNELEVQVVKELFENNWVGIFGSCEGIRRRILHKGAEQLLNSLLSNEIEKNRMLYGKEIKEGIEYVTDCSKNYFSWRMFCFGCDEGRGGKIITRKIKLEGRMYTEVVCEKCDKILNKIRDYLPPFVQDFSHEGYLGWRIPKKFYMQHEGMIEHYSDNFFFHSSDDRTVVLCGSDDGSIDDLIRILVACKLRQE